MITAFMMMLGMGIAAADEGAETAPASTPAAEVSFSLDAAEQVDELSRQQVQWLKPKRVRLPQNPYTHTDFTAYTLEWGEMQVGLMGIRAGVLPGVQVGTSTMLNVAGIPNGQLKISAIHTGPLDVAGVVNHYRHDGGLSARLTSAGLTSSIRLAQPWSLHVSGNYVTGSTSGLPEVGESLTATVMDMTGWNVQDFRADLAEQGAALNMNAELVTLKLATDIRFNRRDSLIIQGQTALWGRIQADTGEVAPPEELGLDEVLNQDSAGPIPLSEAYMATVSWQWSWKRAYLRVGGGVSSVQGAWLMQSTEFALRFGGQTKRDERVLRQSWRSNRRLLRSGADSSIAMSSATH